VRRRGEVREDVDVDGAEGAIGELVGRLDVVGRDRGRLRLVAGPHPLDETRVEEVERLDDLVDVDVAERAATTEAVVLDGIQSTLFSTRSSEGIEVEGLAQYLDGVGSEVSEFNGVHGANFTPNARRRC
jgi:hypothetical protein